jgi:hypothetical protein
MPLHRTRIVTAPDGRLWTVEREVIPKRTRETSPYPDQIDGDRSYWFAWVIAGVPCLAIAYLVFSGVILPALVAAVFAAGYYLANWWRLHQRVRGRAPWKIRASTPPTEYEHGIECAWAVTGRHESERAVDTCADAIHAGTPPNELNPGPPVTP